MDISGISWILFHVFFYATFDISESHLSEIISNHNGSQSYTINHMDLPSFLSTVIHIMQCNTNFVLGITESIVQILVGSQFMIFCI